MSKKIENLSACHFIDKETGEVYISSPLMDTTIDWIAAGLVVLGWAIIPLIVVRYF